MCGLGSAAGECGVLAYYLLPLRQPVCQLPDRHTETRLAAPSRAGNGGSRTTVSAFETAVVSVSCTMLDPVSQEA